MTTVWVVNIEDVRGNVFHSVHGTLTEALGYLIKQNGSIREITLPDRQEEQWCIAVCQDGPKYLIDPYEINLPK